MTRTLRVSLLLAVILASPASAALAAPPEGQLTWALHVGLTPTWFDPAETPGILPRSAPYEELRLKGR